MALLFLQELRVQSYLPQDLQEESLAVEWKGAHGKGNVRLV